jgi:hypothetical protein
MKAAIFFFLVAAVANFFFIGEPDLYDLLHERAIDALIKKGQP